MHEMRRFMKLVEGQYMKLVEGTWEAPQRVEQAQALARAFRHPISAKRFNDGLLDGLIGDDQLGGAVATQLHKDGPHTDVRHLVASTLQRWIGDGLNDGRWRKKWDKDAIQILRQMIDTFETVSNQEMEERQINFIKKLAASRKMSDAQIANAISHRITNDPQRIRAILKLIKTYG